MKERKRVVISTVFSGRAVKVAVKNLKPDKIIFIVDEPIHETKKETIEKLKDNFRALIDIKTMKTSLYDIPEIMKKVVKKIDEESGKGNEIILHITEGRKITSLALLFSGYARREKVSGSYYVEEETNKMLSLPVVIRFDINENEKRFLQEIENGAKNPETIMKNTGFKQSVVYKYTKELREEGYLEEVKELKLTEVGRIASI